MITRLKFVYIVTSTFESTEKNYQEGTFIENVFIKKEDAIKRIAELKKLEDFDDCVSVSYEVTGKRLL